MPVTGRVTPVWRRRSAGFESRRRHSEYELELRPFSWAPQRHSYQLDIAGHTSQEPRP